MTARAGGRGDASGAWPGGGLQDGGRRDYECRGVATWQAVDLVPWRGVEALWCGVAPFPYLELSVHCRTVNAAGRVRHRAFCRPFVALFSSSESSVHR